MSTGHWLGACMIFSKRNMDILKSVYVQKKLADIVMMMIIMVIVRNVLKAPP
jgi:hypothetical protein